MIYNQYYFTFCFLNVAELRFYLSLQSKVKTEDDTDYSDTQSPVSLPDETSSPQENTIDSTVQTDHEGEEEGFRRTKMKTFK